MVWSKQQERVPFKNIKELENIVLGLDTAKFVDVTVDGKKVENYRGIWNIDSKRLEAIVSDKYSLMQHKETFLPVVDSLRKLGIKVCGNVIKEEGRVFMDVLFDDERFKLDIPKRFLSDKEIKKLGLHKGDEINFGMRFGNSYDGSMSFYAETYALRLVCLNGMVGAVSVSTVRYIHIGGPKAVESAISSTMKQLAVECPKFMDVVSRTMKEEISGAVIIAFLKSIKMGKKHTQRLLEKVKEIDCKTQWGLYNILTDYITHTLQIRESSKEFWHKTYANPLLEEPIQTLIQSKKTKPEVAA